MGVDPKGESRLLFASGTGNKFMPPGSHRHCLEDARRQIFELDSVALAKIHGLFAAFFSSSTLPGQA